MSKGRDATTITDSTGRRRLTKLWDGGSRRALRAPSRGAGRHAAPSSGPRRRDGVLVVRSCARPRGDARAVAAAAPSPRVDAASCRVSALPSGRRVPSFLGPATRRWASRRSTRTASADDGRLGQSNAPENGGRLHAIDATLRLLDGMRAAQHTHTQRASTRGDRAPPRSGRARRDEAGGLQPRGLCG